MSENHNEGTGGAPVLMFIAGAVVGAGLALLLAPASGEDTRRRLGDTARRLKDQTKDRVGQARETLSNLKDDAKHAVASGRDAFMKGRDQIPEGQGVGAGHSDASR